MNHLSLDTNMEAVNQAFRIALGDLYGNISYFQDGLLSLASEALENSLLWFEEREYNPDRQLFSGAACYGDGISAYGDAFARENQGESASTTGLWQIPTNAGEKTAEWVCPYILCPPTVCTSWPTSGLWIWPGNWGKKKNQI